VLQEFVAARQVIFIYGGRTIPSMILSPVLMFLIKQIGLLSRRGGEDVCTTMLSGLSSNDLYPEIRAKVERLPVSGPRARFVLHPNQDSNLMSLLTHSRDCGASDKRDHVYAFLGLTKNAYGINVDYSSQNDTATAFTETARRLIEHSDNLSILLHVDMRNGKGLEYPSWVPDWSSDTSRVWHHDLGTDLAGTLDTDDYTPYKRASAKFLDSNRTLEMSGTYLATVEETQGPIFQR
jgi:hypothetical protein